MWSKKVKSLNKKYFDIHKAVFYPSALFLLLLIGISFFYGDTMATVFNSLQEFTSKSAGWFFILAMNVYVIVALRLAFSKYGDIRLGGKGAKPDFSTFAWFSMLFSAGLGIGLMFYGVAEPMFHYSNPPLTVADHHEQAEQAMLFTFLHYGLHGWGAYVIVGLALAYFTFNKGLPLTISSLFYPILGERVHGWIGHLVDVVAVVATVLGLSTTLGLGVSQIGAGVEYLFAFENTTELQVLLIGIITAFATLSVVLGLDKGVRFLSEWNMRLALIFMFGLLFLGPTFHLLDSFVQNTGNYFSNIIKVGSWAESYSSKNWQHDWTVFYWGWWISWSPFVGMFIARVSRGRTIREFVLGVLLAPSLLVFLWMTIFGGTAIHLQHSGVVDIASAVNEDLSTALFVLLEEFPFSQFTSVVGIVLITVFFVTSSDSGSLVVDSITSGGKLDAPVGQRIFWALTEGAVAAALLFAGGLKALQSAVISIGLPFSIILLFVCYALYKELELNAKIKKTKAEKKERKAQKKYMKKLIESEMEEI